MTFILILVLLLALLAGGLGTVDLITDYFGPGQDSLLPYANTTGSLITAGDMVVLASGATGYVGVAQGDIAATTGTGTVLTRGVVNAAKTAGEAFTVGQILYWDPSARSLTGTNTTVNTRAGRSMQAIASAATSAQLILNG